MTLQFDLADFLRTAVVAVVRSDQRDLTARQFGVLLTCGTRAGPHTVRDLGRHLHVAKPAITRATDRLEAEGLVRRMRDLRDRRSVNIVMTTAGDAYLDWLLSLLADAATSAAAAAPAAKPAGKRRRRPTPPHRGRARAAGSVEA